LVSEIFSIKVADTQADTWTDTSTDNTCKGRLKRSRRRAKTDVSKTKQNYQISTNSDNLWHKDGKQSKIT